MPEAFKKSTVLNATNLRIGLFASIIIILGLTAAGFWFANQHLMTYAEEISKKKIDAQASNSSVSTLEKIQSDLDNYRSISEKISQLRASNDLPEFKIVEEIQRIAKKNQIQISNYSYGGDSSATSTAPAAGGTTTAPTTTTPTTPTAGGAAAPATSGKSISLTVNIASPVNYKNYLQFLYDIEQNIPKMQIKSVGISRSGGSSDGSTPANANSGGSSTPPVSSTPASPDSVSVEPLIVEMYTQ